MPVSILHIINGEQYSGLERVVDTIAEAAPDFGYRVHFACLVPGDFARRMHAANAFVHETPMRNRFDLSCVFRIRSIVERQSCQLVHSHTARGALVARVLRMRWARPWMHHVHSPALYESEIRWMNRINFHVEKSVLHSADRLMPVSRSLSNYLQSQYGIIQESILLLENGVPIQQASVPPTIEKGQTIVLGMVGLFRPRKGLETALGATAILHAEGIPVRLLLVGDFVSYAYRSHIANMVESSGLIPHVQFAGFEGDVVKRFQPLDIFLLPSLFGEGLPMALLEAMSFARVIVASDIEGVTETLDHGNCGTLVKPGDPVALAHALRTLLAAPDMARRKAANAKERQINCYSTYPMVKSLFEEYDRVIGLQTPQPTGSVAKFR